MHKLFARILVPTIALFLIGCLTACSSDKQSSQDPMENFRYSVLEEETSKIPYTLSGENKGWVISVNVREATSDEKDLMIQTIDNQIFVFEENYSVHHSITKEQYEGLINDAEKQKEDIFNNAVYISNIMGQYTGEQEIKTSEKAIFCKAMSQQTVDK